MRKNILVFGGSKGIGSVFTQRLIEADKYNITLFSRSNPNKFDVDFRSVDFCRQREFLITLKQSILDKKIHHLVFFLKFRGSDRVELDSFNGEIKVELETIKNVMETLTPQLENGGSIVMVSSMCGRLITNSQPIGYHLSKAALEQMARFYAVTLGKRNIRVNVVAPSLTLKPENMAFYRNEVDLVNLYSKICPLGRIAKSEDICEVVEFLLNVSFMTGQVLKVDGGVSLQEYEGLCRSIVQEYLGFDLQTSKQGESMKSVILSAGGGALINTIKRPHFKVA